MLTLSRIATTQLPIPGTDAWFAKPGDPALSVMTDFRERTSITVPATAQIDVALEHMKHTGVRSAFAIDEVQRVVVGLITAYDIMGEKPMRHMRASDIKRDQVLVRDLMTRPGDWLVLQLRQLESGTVGEVDRLFETTQLTHIAVIEAGERGEPRLRGLLSAARVRRVLVR
jgi:CBS-domain-containing membrane protein